MKAPENISRARFRSRLIGVAGCFLLLLLIFSLKAHPEFVERYYSEGLYRFIRGGVQFVFNYLPFSAGDLLYSLIIVSVIAGLYRMVLFLVRKDFRRAGFLFLGFILKFEIAICAFYLLWAVNYFRQPAPERLGLQDYDYTQEQLVTVASMLIDSANASRLALTPRDLAVSNQEILAPDR